LRAASMTGKLPGHGLPTLLRDRLESGGWIRTAHGGFTSVGPANSLRAIRAAIELGVDMVEVDIHRTADGHLALWHDRTFPIGDAHIPIADTRLMRLQSVDIGHGERIIELGDALDAVRGRAALLIDLKADGLAAPIVDMVRGRESPAVAVCGHYWETLREIERRAPEIGTSLTLDRRWRDWYGEGVIERIDTDAVTVDWRIADPVFIARCHAQGLAVLAWTVDDLALMRRLLALGVDGLTSNRADLFASVHANRAESERG
jgi:glycerophosphoryl diester phosphodiesterase